ncbi:pyridoxamine 5'-phosphate oxidase family protein [Elongatibacter sediminis]|uniref:Pyridoxamine 5'-phosphate oxidase putative domain-containing protein n=1 Tax=Elongatibacter sediminis TaxID=3119006 RepID=A0AAW9RET3_9GAMM
MSEIRDTSAWNRAQIEMFLNEQRIPIRLACITPSGAPLVCSLWYGYHDDALWCATQNNARVVRYLTEYPACGFEIAPESAPYRGVRGQADAHIDAGAGRHELELLIDRYLDGRESAFAQWLLRRADQEVAIRIEPRWMTAWDFTARMTP